VAALAAALMGQAAAAPVPQVLYLTDRALLAHGPGLVHATG